MPFDLRLERDGSYVTDIEEICRKIRGNGTNRTTDALNVSCGDAEAMLFINLAYSSNKIRDPNLAESLYIVGFKGKNNENYRFNDPAFAGMVPENPKIFHASNGSYSKLGYPNGFFDNSGAPLLIDKAGLVAALDVVSKYQPGNNQDIRPHLTKLIIVSSEAVRSSVVSENVGKMLQGNSSTYAPQKDWDVMHAWGGKSLSL